MCRILWSRSAQAITHWPRAVGVSLETLSKEIFVDLTADRALRRLVDKVFAQHRIRGCALKPKALIFDMDGVLVDSEPLHERAKREAFRKAGIVLPEERFATLIGRGDEAMLKDLASEFSLSAEQSAEILRQKNAFYKSSESTLRPIPGSLDFVHWSHRHFRLALATSASPRYRHFLMKKFDIEALFEVVVDAALVKAPKPSPEVLSL